MSTKLEQCDWEEIEGLLGSGSVNSQRLNLKEYIKIIDNEFIPHSIVSGNSYKHKGKIPLNRDCDDVDNGLDNTCEVIRQETVLFSTPETDYIIYD